MSSVFGIFVLAHKWVQSFNHTKTLEQMAFKNHTSPRHSAESNFSTQRELTEYMRATGQHTWRNLFSLWELWPSHGIGLTREDSISVIREKALWSQAVEESRSTCNLQIIMDSDTLLGKTLATVSASFITEEKRGQEALKAHVIFSRIMRPCGSPVRTTEAPPH